MVRLEEADTDEKVEIVMPESRGRAHPSVDKLGSVGVPDSLLWLKATAEAMLRVPRAGPPPRTRSRLHRLKPALWAAADGEHVAPGAYPLLGARCRLFRSGASSHRHLTATSSTRITPGT